MNTFKEYFLKLIFITVSMLILSAPLVWLQIYYPHQIHSISHFLTKHDLEFTIFRWLLIVTFFVAWPALIRHLSQKYHWENIKTEFWLRQRYRITMWIILFELIVRENLLVYAFGKIF